MGYSRMGLVMVVDNNKEQEEDKDKDKDNNRINHNNSLQEHRKCYETKLC